MPKVSICIPAYQQVKYLRKTLSSVLEQTFTDYEVVISDDSADNSVKDLLAEFDFKGKLKYFKNTPALGSPANWNFSIAKASGTYIKIMHHDDFFTSSGSLEKFVNMLDDNPAASFAFSGTEIMLLSFDKKKTHACKQKKTAEIISRPEILFFSNYIGAPSAVIFRNTNMVLFDPNFKWLVDIDWYIQMIKSGSLVVNTPETLICTVHGAEGQVTQSVIADKNIQIKEHVYLVNKLFTGISDINKFSIYFQLLFQKYNIENSNDLRLITDVPSQLESFFTDVFEFKNNHVFFKKLNYWIQKKTLSDYLFTFKTLFK